MATASASRFLSTASYYVKFRFRYPPSLLKQIAERCGLDGTGRLLDLGCGPGFLAIAMAPYFEEVVGMDPEPEMLAMAKQEAESAGVKLTLVAGSSADLGKHLGNFRMTIMGRSFHWMDRPATLVALNEIIVDGGAVVLISDGHTSAPENEWKRISDRVARRWAPETSRLRELRRSPEWVSNATMLERSPFSRIEQLNQVASRDLSLDQIIGRAFSTSVTSPAVLGDKREGFERELRAELMRFSPSGRFTEILDVDVLIARRP